MSSDLSKAHRCGSETSSHAYAKAVASAPMDNVKIASLFFTSLEVADLETARRLCAVESGFVQKPTPTEFCSPAADCGAAADRVPRAAAGQAPAGADTRI